MRMKSKPFFLFPILLVLAMGCKSPKADFTEFNQFYDQFMQDSVFQIQHINFPMEGVPDNAVAYGDSLNTFRWTAENWRIHRPVDFTKTKFEQVFQTVGDELIIENISDASTNYGMVRRWAKIGGQWSLIYYAGLNPLQ